MREPWDGVKESPQPVKPLLQPSSKPPLVKATEKSDDSDPRVTAMATLYERQMKAKMDREKRMVQEKERRQSLDMASCTFSPRINESSRQVVGGSAPNWETTKLNERSMERSRTGLFQALGWDEPLVRDSQIEHRTPTKSSPHNSKIGKWSRSNDFGERLYDQAMRLKELKLERARLQDEEDRQSRQFVARRYRSTSPSHRDRNDMQASSSQVKSQQENMHSLFNERMWLPQDLLKPSELLSQSLNWPGFVDRQESFIRKREEKLKNERELQSKLKAAPMSPGSQQILNGLRSSAQNHRMEGRDAVHEMTFNEWKARSKSQPRSDDRNGLKNDSEDQRHRPSVSRILRPAASRNRALLSDANEPATFKPSITAQAARRRPSSIIELHDGGRSRREAWRLEQKLLREEEEVQEMTLRPSISPSSYHKISLIRQNPDAFVARWRTKQAMLEEKRKSSAKEREEAELKECTFRPKINTSLPTFILKKPQRLLAEYSHYENMQQSDRISRSLMSLESSSQRSYAFSSSKHPSHSGHGDAYGLQQQQFPTLQPKMNGHGRRHSNETQEKEETLWKALELLNDVDAFLAIAKD